MDTLQLSKDASQAILVAHGVLQFFATTDEVPGVFAIAASDRERRKWLTDFRDILVELANNATQVCEMADEALAN